MTRILQKTVTTRRHRNSSPIFRIIVLLLPAGYCSWRAFWFALTWQTNTTGTGTWSSSVLVPAPVDHYLSLPLRVNATKAKDRINPTRKNLKDGTACFSFNSRKWLDGPRLGNCNASHGDRDNDDDIVFLISRPSLTTTATILRQQAFCGPQSPFQSISVGSSNTDRLLWTTRLLYLAVHWHQHSPALPEAQHRHRHANPHCPQQAFANSSRVGSFDYECPTAKFLVVAFSKNGIGANLRLVAVPALMVGLATQRVVLFVNDAPVGPDFVRQPWTLASCRHRRDAQCFFRPASPCVLTEQELAEAYQLNRGERRRLFRYGTLPEEHVLDRVLLMHLGSLRPQREPENLRQVLFQLSQTVLERIVGPVQVAPASDNVHSRATTTDDLLRRAAQDILWVPEEKSTTTGAADETVNATFSYYGVNSPIFQSLLLYAMRPNTWAVNEMDAILTEMFPPNFDPHDTIGLPIRGKPKAVYTFFFFVL